MSKHTPGPWGLDAGPHQLPDIYAGHDLVPGNAPLAPYVSIAEIRGRTLPFEEALANARLISAAPDFLAACDGPEADVTALQWLSALLSEVDAQMGALVTDDRQALYHAYSQSCRLLRDLQAAAAKARGESEAAR